MKENKVEVNKIKRFIILFFVILLLIIVILKAFFPIAICKIDIPNDVSKKIEDHSQEVYSPTLPLLPVCVVIDSYENNKYYYSVYYFPFGSVRMSLAEDGFYMEERLSGSNV